MRRLPIIALVVAATLSVGAGTPLTRRDGFLLIWQSIQRQAFPTRETPYTDVTEGTKGFTEIRYAKARGLLDDAESFEASDPLTLGDALVWLFRTRNITDDPEEVTRDTLGAALERYPIANPEADMKEPLDEAKLLALMQMLDAKLVAEEHEISLYGEKFHGKGTAFGEQFDMHALTAAHRALPHNTLVRVTNVENGKSVVVRINDRGPFVPGRDMDLSLASFITIAPRSKGKIQATFERLGDVTLLSQCSTPADDGTTTSRPEQQRLGRTLRLTRGVPHTLPLGQTVTLAGDSRFIVRAVVYPDGTRTRFQQTIDPGNTFTLTPSIAGDYAFELTENGRRVYRMRMSVDTCAALAI